MGRMEWKRLGWRWMLAGGLALAVTVRAQETPSSSSPDAPRLTLDTSALQWPEGVPDVRLKLRRPTWRRLSSLDPDLQIQGLEFRLPLSAVWVGVEETPESEDRRATFSIRRGF